MKSLKPLLLPFAIAAALTACQTHDQSAASANTATSQPATPALPPLATFNVSDLDTTKNACADFAGYVNGKWLAANPVPADRTTWGSFEMLDERSQAASRSIAEAAAANANAQGVEKLVGDFFASGMDTARINAAGLAPIQPMLDRIAALKTPADIAQYLRDEFAAGRGEVFSFGAESDFKDATRKIGFAFQGGLSLPEKAYYLEDGPDGKYKAIREAFVKHVSRQLQNAGVAAADADKQAADVLAFETRLAKASLSPVELRDPNNQYHYVSLAEADKLTPHFSWTEFFKANGVQADGFSLSQPRFFAEFDRMLADVPASQWQAYLRLQLIDGMAPYLADRFNDERFDFYARTLRGQKEQKPRWKRVLDTTEGSVGEALGQLYVKQYFPPESKAEMAKLVDNLRLALKARLENLDWMSPDTKAKAMEKWASFTPKIGYPDKWRSWDGLNTRRDDYAGNVLAAARFNHAWEMSKIGKPVDRSEWGMTPQTVNAYYNPLMNEIVFPAAILQPPFFDPKADPALNYGGIGAVIGHEMMHGYDDQGSQFDAKGNFNNWWTKADRDGFNTRTAKLVKQFDDYVAIDGLHVKGALTLGENIADLGGLNVAWDAYQNALKAAGKRGDEKIDGYPSDQRFFFNWATVWRRNFTPDELKVRLNTDPHAPANFRAIGAPSNMPAFAHAFGCKAGDPMVRADDQRVVIW
ncbi:MAG: peptidase [Thermomonas hydrothermalis]|uniref:M13 family metallopeptidase n=1 Tax=Thermomonas hydrothermalis TaxID=213588 RepID=UPI002356555B|nr:M13-type metalloendopeptidase [Thermomonas hydrothermalis]MCL6618813.1 peptidase [Thermomonas hydrothermalis]